MTLPIETFIADTTHAVELCRDFVVCGASRAEISARIHNRRNNTFAPTSKKITKKRAKAMAEAMAETYRVLHGTDDVRDKLELDGIRTKATRGECIAAVEAAERQITPHLFDGQHQEPIAFRAKVSLALTVLRMGIMGTAAYALPRCDRVNSLLLEIAVDKKASKQKTQRINRSVKESCGPWMWAQVAKYYGYKDATKFRNKVAATESWPIQDLGKGKVYIDLAHLRVSKPKVAAALEKKMRA